MGVYYSNAKKIKEVFKAMGLAIPQDPNGVISQHFHNRHLLVHRNGKLKDESFFVVNKEMIDSLIGDVDCYVNQIMQIVRRVN